MRWLLVTAIALGAGMPSAAIAQQDEVEGRSVSSLPPIRSDLEREALAPGHSSREERDSRLGPRPRFIEPAATTTEHTRLGASAWITESPPFERRENPGGVAIGFTIAWPPPPNGGPSTARP
jgi:hypothetical protein